MYYLVKLLWLLVKAIPVSVRTPLRKSLLLSSGYTALLCKVGLHPSVNMTLAKARQHTTSELPEDQDYIENIRYQQAQIESVLAEHTILQAINAVVLIIKDWDADLSTLSLNSIHAQSVIPDNIVVVCLPDQKVTIELYFNKLDATMQTIFVVDAVSQLAQHELLKKSAFVLYQGDELHPDCLAIVASQAGTADLLYVDTDQKVIDHRFDPHFLPDWNPDLQLATEYIQTGVYAKHLAVLIGLEVHDMSIAKFFNHCYLTKIDLDIQHQSLVLLHRSQDAAEDNTTIVDTSELFISQQTPLVSLIIPTYNGKELVEACIESILDKTTYLHYEILLIDNNSDNSEALAYFDSLNLHPKINVLKYPHPFNYSAINNFGVANANGDVIALVNNDIEVIEPDWLSKMLSHVLRSDIACVGAKLLYSNGLVQHAGVVMGYGGGAGHAHKYFQSDAPGYMNRALATQNFSAVTAACLLVTKEDFDSVGGLNEIDLTVAFNDVDFCLRLLETGKRNLLCAEAVLYHHESVSRGHEDTLEKQKRFRSEVDYLQTTWAKYIAHDPAYNPNLTRRYENFTINTELTH